MVQSGATYAQFRSGPIHGSRMGERFRLWSRCALAGPITSSRDDPRSHSRDARLIAGTFSTRSQPRKASASGTGAHLLVASRAALCPGQNSAAASPLCGRSTILFSAPLAPEPGPATAFVLVPKPLQHPHYTFLNGIYVHQSVRPARLLEKSRSNPLPPT